MSPRKLAAIAVAGLVLPFAAAGTAQADTTCMASAKGAIVADHVSCSTATRVLVKASDRLANSGTMHPNVTVNGRYWMCTAKFHGSNRGSIACAYDSRHAVAATVRF